jgi:hypothetical protein
MKIYRPGAWVAAVVEREAGQMILEWARKPVMRIEP